MYSRRQMVQGIFCQPDRSIQVVSGQSVESITEILAIAEQRKDENDNSFCNIYEYAAG